MTPALLHLHTYFFFPFSIDKEIVAEAHPEQWRKYRHWIDGLDEWIASHHSAGQSVASPRLGYWERAAHSRFDMESPSYQDMVFFHPFVRRVFFDTCEMPGPSGAPLALIRCYRIPIPEGRRLWLKAEDTRGRGAVVQVTDLRLFLFANGMGILSIGIEAWNIPVRQALWINEQMRKLYPSSGRQIREGRGMCRVCLILDEGGREECLAEETFQTANMVGFHPPLSRVITTLLYFMDYERQEYEQVLDERMIVYSYAAIDPSSIPEDFVPSEAYEVMLSRFLYVDQDGPGFRYDPEFIRAQMKEHLYRRWAHEGTYYGFTSYSSITMTLGVYDRGEHVVKEGFLIHRMFDTRYYLMAIVALFYRATLLDFAENSALVSKRLYLDQAEGKLSRENIELANFLRAEFLHFSNYWYFEELANKDEESEHFTIQCRAYRIGAVKEEVEQEIEKMNTSLHQYYQDRNTQAVNRLAMLSMILGAGAVLTGYFGMNFGHEFARFFFEPDPSRLMSHYLAIAFVTLFSAAMLALGAYLVVANWADYRDVFVLLRAKVTGPKRWYSLKRAEFPRKRNARRALPRSRPSNT